MNRLVLAFVGIAVSCNAFGQSNTFPSTGNVGIGTSSPSTKLDVNGVLQLYNKDHNYATWDNIKIWAGGESSYIESTGDENGMVIRSNFGGKILLMSNVGIGTMNPAEKLSVNGNIRAHEIKVETNNWPDYVFDKRYRLLPLPELEAYIEEKGHLPGIPSSEEAQTNGVALGEMNRKLLEKIEELTLHLIEQSKAIKDLKEEVNILKQKP